MELSQSQRKNSSVLRKVCHPVVKHLLSTIEGLEATPGIAMQGWGRPPTHTPLTPGKLLLAGCAELYGLAIWFGGTQTSLSHILSSSYLEYYIIW